MAAGSNSRAAWAVCLSGIIAAGILSRVLHTGFVIFDKYLGDALYAAMVYVILRALRNRLSAAEWAAIIMTALELFQLTLLPAHWLQNGHFIVRIVARLMGTEFSFVDLATYAVGIGCAYLVDAVALHAVAPH